MIENKCSEGLKKKKNALLQITRHLFFPSSSSGSTQLLSNSQTFNSFWVEIISASPTQRLDFRGLFTGK